jgi:fido (protein-threonine AMPylation protein)
VVAERLAVNIARCLEALLDSTAEAMQITPEWICAIHRQIAGELFPDWAGRFRNTDVQVGTHLPPRAFEVPVQVRNYCLDLAERLHHLPGVESIADFLAWADWRFQWIHPFKDFNGRVGRILLVALSYKLNLPPINPAAGDASGRRAYFDALRAADAGNLAPLSSLWFERLLG